MSPLGGIGFLAVPPNLLSWVRGSGGSIILGERGVHDDLGEGWWKLEAGRRVRLDLEERKQEIVLWIVNIHHELGCPKGKSLKLPQSAYPS